MIKLSKIPHHKLNIVYESLKHYLATLEDTQMDETQKLYYSIADELKYNVGTKAAKRFPSEKTSIKLLYHQGMILSYAFKSYQQTFFVTDFEHAVIENINSKLHPQLL